MGNRLARSPKKRANATRTAAAAKKECEATARSIHGEQQQDVTMAAASASSGGDHDMGDTSISAEATQPHWSHLVTTVHALEAFEAPVKEVTERQRLRGDPMLFFAHYGAGGDADADDALSFAHALLLAADGSDRDAVAKAAALLRRLARRPMVTSLATDARLHLTQCLLLLDPTLQGTTTAAEVELLLVECLQGDVDHELAKQAAELLAHVRFARGEIRSAAELLGDIPMVRQGGVDFQRLGYRLLASDDLTPTTSHDTTSPPLSLHAKLLLADAEALVAGPQ